MTFNYLAVPELPAVDMVLGILSGMIEGAPLFGPAGTSLTLDESNAAAACSRETCCPGLAS